MLWKADEWLERLQMPYVLLGTAAYNVFHNEPIKTTKLIFGIHSRYCIPELTNLMPVIIPHVELQTDGWRITENGITIILRILTQQHPTLKDPNTVRYHYWQFRVPNPFDQYWLGDHYDV